MRLPRRPRAGFQGKDVVQITYREIEDIKWLRRYGGANHHPSPSPSPSPNPNHVTLYLTPTPTPTSTPTLTVALAVALTRCRGRHRAQLDGWRQGAAPPHTHPLPPLLLALASLPSPPALLSLLRRGGGGEAQGLRCGCGSARPSYGRVCVSEQVEIAPLTLARWRSAPCRSSIATSSSSSTRSAPGHHSLLACPTPTLAPPLPHPCLTLAPS